MSFVHFGAAQLCDLGLALMRKKCLTVMDHANYKRKDVKRQAEVKLFRLIVFQDLKEKC